MRHRSFPRVLVALALLCLSASLAGASTIYYYIDVFGGSLTATTTVPGSITMKSAGQAVTVYIPELNMFGANPGFAAPALGYEYALSAVNLTLDWQSAGSVQISNLSCFHSTSFTNPADLSTGNACEDIPFAGASANVQMQLSVDSVTVDAPGVAGPISGTAPYDVPANSPLWFQSTFAGLTGSCVVGSTCPTNASADLDDFEGAGASSASATVTNQGQTYGGSVSAPYPAYLSFGGSATTGAILEVEYTFNEQLAPVPEPVTMVLTGSALIGLGIYLRRRRSRV